MNKILNKTINDCNNKDYECPPQSLDRYQSMFSSAERLQIYEHVLKNTDCQKLPEPYLNINLNEMDFSEQSNHLSLPEELAKQRDMKRRRAKYRKAGCRGYKRELRDMIETQMEMYAKLFGRSSEPSYKNSMQGTNTLKFIESSTTDSVVEKDHKVDENYKKLPGQLTYNSHMSSGRHSQHFTYSGSNYFKQEYKHNHNKNRKELHDDNSVIKRHISDYVRGRPQHNERKFENVEIRQDRSEKGNSVSKGHFSDKHEYVEKCFETSQKRYEGYENCQTASKKYLLNESQDKHSHNDKYLECSRRSYKYESNVHHHSKCRNSANDSDLEKSDHDKKRHKGSKHKSHKHKRKTSDSDSDSSTKKKKKHKKYKKSDRKH